MTGLAKIYSRGRIGAVVAVAALVATSTMVGSASAEWKPDHTVEIVVPSGAGGGNDRTARTLQQIFKELGILTDTAVLNKPGGGGAVSYAYTHSHAGDGHYISVARTGLHSNHIIGRSPINYEDMTPLAMVTDDNQVIAVRSDSSIKTIDDMVKALQKDPQSISIALGSSRGSTTEMVVAKLATQAGVDPTKLRAVTFDGGAESVKNVLGGHVDAVCIGIGNVLDFYKSGEMRILAFSTAERVSQLPDVPTLREQGYDIVVGAWTTIVGPPGLSDDQIAYWEATLEKATQHPLWKELNKSKFVDDWFLGADEAKKYLASTYDDLDKLLKALGMAKQ